jgi:hypothetical protein
VKHVRIYVELLEMRKLHFTSKYYATEARVN